MKNQTIEQTQKQIEMTKEIQSIFLNLYISENSDFAKQELKSIDEKLSTYYNFKIQCLEILKTEKEFLIVWNAETGHTEKFTISKLKAENEKEGFFEWVPTFLESEHFLNRMKLGQVELMETERDCKDDDLKVAVYRIK